MAIAERRPDTPLVSDDLEAALQSLIAAEWATEVSAGFPRLRRMPSTAIRKFLRYRETLAPIDEAVLRGALVSRGTMAFGLLPGPLVGAEMAAFQAWMSRGLLGGHGLESSSLRLAKMSVTAARSDPQMAAMLAGHDPAELDRIANTETAKAARLRKLIAPRLKDRFDLTPRNGGGAVWYYENATSGIRLGVDYGGRSQLRYWLRTAPAAGLRPTMLSLEGAFGLSQDWDWITNDGADDAAALLADSVADCLALVERATT